MNTHIPSPDNLLHAWLDEELDPRHEPQFFALLATDVDLRDKLRHLRSIRDEAKRFGAAAEPPKATTSALFEKLGFESTVKPTALKQRAAVLPLFSRAWSPVATAAAAAAITAMLFLGLQNTEVNSFNGEFVDAQPAPTPPTTVLPTTNSHSSPPTIGTPSNDKSAISPTYADISSIQEDPPPTSANNQTNSHITSSTIDDNSAYIADASPTFANLTPIDAETSPTTADLTGDDPVVPQSDASINGTISDIAPTDSPILASNTDSAPTETSVSSIDIDYAPIFADNAEISETFAVVEDIGQAPSAWVSPSIHDDLASQSAFRSGGTIPDGMHAVRELPGDGQLQAVDTRQYFPNLGNSELSSAFSVEIRGMNTVSFPEATMGTASNPWMQNMAIAVYHGMEQHDIGIEYGQEPFAMHYHGVENGKAVRYEQNLLTPWLLASWRYRMEPISALAGIEPYVMAGTGSSLQLWPIARAGIGLMYMPDRRVRFNIGLEGSLLAYPYQSNWFTSHRYGLTYGLSVLF